MRIEIDKLVEIQKVVDCQVEVGGVDKDSITLRFGYWNKLSDSDFAAVKHILGHRDLILQLVDEDDDCGELWNYKVTYNPFK
jgi:hypothetical protein